MNFREPKEIIRNLFKKNLIKEDNVVYADKLFIINSVISYLFKNKYYKDVDKQQLMQYGELINRYLKDEVDIYWQDDILMVREIDE